MKQGLTKRTECCGEPLRYSVSAVLIVLLLGLMPAACSHPEGKAVSQGEPRSSPAPPLPRVAAPSPGRT